MLKIEISKSLLSLCIVLFGYIVQAKADTTDNYQIYLNEKIVIRESHYNNPLSSTIEVLILDSTNYNDTIKINYSHCISGAVNRQIVIKDTSGKIIFSRYYPNKNEKTLMVILVKDILCTESINSNSGLIMHYYDQQLLPDGIILTLIGIRDKSANICTKSVSKSNNLFIVGLTTLLLIFLFAFWRPAHYSQQEN